MRLAADARSEVHESAVGRPRGGTGVEIPACCEIDGSLVSLEVSNRPDIQIARSAMIQLLLDDHVGAEGAGVGKIRAVGRETEIAIDIAVIGQPRHVPVDRYGPEIGAVVLQ